MHLVGFGDVLALRQFVAHVAEVHLAVRFVEQRPCFAKRGLDHLAARQRDGPVDRCERREHAGVGRVGVVARQRLSVHRCDGGRQQVFDDRTQKHVCRVAGVRQLDRLVCELQLFLAELEVGEDRVQPRLQRALRGLRLGLGAGPFEDGAHACTSLARLRAS